MDKVQEPSSSERYISLLTRGTTVSESNTAHYIHDIAVTLTWKPLKVKHITSRSVHRHKLSHFLWRVMSVLQHLPHGTLSPSREADGDSASQEAPRLLRNPKAYKNVQT
jgi:hypothetical protein